MSTPPQPVEAKPAATILLLRDAPEFQVLMVKRHHQIDFVGGALVFPGGRSHGGDHDPAWSGHARGWADYPPDQRALRIAAIREAWEEAGILVAERLDGQRLTEVSDLAVREAVDAGEMDFLTVVRSLGVRLTLDALTVFAHWITPKGGHKRFDTWFYAVRAPGDQVAACDGREAVDAEWVSPGEALRLGAAGERMVVFPTRMNLKLLGEASSAEEAVAQAAARRLVTVCPDIQTRGGERVLVLPPDAGYGPVVEPLGGALG